MAYPLFSESETPLGDLHPADGQTLAQVIWLSGLVPPPPLCSGLGRCGRCRVLLEPAPPPCEAELALLPADAVARGWRLACRRVAGDLPDGTRITLPPQPAPRRHTNHTAPCATQVLLAVDLGTTSLCWQALLPDGTPLAHGQEINPQMGAGADVLSRLSVARSTEGRRLLHELTLAALRRIVADLPQPVSALCLAANTAMTALVCDADISGLTGAPYRLPVRGDCVYTAAGLPPVYLPPQPAPFVGGDLSAGMVALLGRDDVAFPFLLADMGTNGEFVLASDAEHSYIASVPLGPALEGIGLTFGDMAGSGVVTGFTLHPSGLAATTLDGTPPARVCGTGYLSLVQTLRRVGVLDVDGRFNTTPASPLGKKLASTLYTRDGSLCLPLTTDGRLYLTARDVEEILKVKAAFSLAVARLLAVAQLTSVQLRRVYVAGALGEHISPAALEDLGFLPQGCGQRLCAAGNTALAGARELLLHPCQRQRLAAWSRRCELVDLTHAPDFITLYLNHMHFTYETALYSPHA